MSSLEYDYLRSLPLAIHLPSLHTYLVHAGILPIDPTKGIHDRNQPLSRVPAHRGQRQDEDELRTKQELSLLSIRQNKEPWTLLNMRSITKRGKVSRKNSHTPWSEIWNEVQDLCGGFNVDQRRTAPGVSDENGDDGEEVPIEDEELKKKQLPCHPTTIVYGHAAARGLDIKRWSTGIDTGCVYGRRLTALVIGDHRSKDIDAPGGAEELEELRFGDSMKARLVGVDCPAPDS